MKEGYPTQLDEIDQWLFDNFDILPGCCSSILDLKHTIAREVAEKLWPKNDVPLPEDSVLFNKGVAEGRRLEREDLALTWEDMLTIDVFLNNVREEKCTKKLGEYYREVLKRFNEAKGR